MKSLIFIIPVLIIKGNSRILSGKTNVDRTCTNKVSVNKKLIKSTWIDNGLTEFFSHCTENEVFH